MSGDDVRCECCKAERWMYCVWQCNGCKIKFYGDKWNPNPYCDCGFDMGFTKITDGKEYFQLHHITYKNLGDEKDGDLKILCLDCHRLVHSLIKLYPRLNIENAVLYVKSKAVRFIFD